MPPRENVEMEKAPEPEQTSDSETTFESIKTSDSIKTTEFATTSEAETGLFPDRWMIRQCDMYKDEYDDCTSIKARFHQYFIFGKMLDCGQWKTDYHNCYVWEKYNSESAYKDLVESEKHRRITRLRGHFANNVWEKRDKPPENWNNPLPEWMEKDFDNTYLKYKSQQIKEGRPDSIPDRYCTIL